MQLVAKVDADSCSRVDASCMSDVPWRRWSRSTWAVMLERVDGVLDASAMSGWIFLSMMHFWLGSDMLLAGSICRYADGSEVYIDSLPAGVMKARVGNNLPPQEAARKPPPNTKPLTAREMKGVGF